MTATSNISGDYIITAEGDDPVWIRVRDGELVGQTSYDCADCHIQAGGGTGDRLAKIHWDSEAECDAVTSIAVVEAFLGRPLEPGEIQMYVVCRDI